MPDSTHSHLRQFQYGNNDLIQMYFYGSKGFGEASGSEEVDAFEVVDKPEEMEDAQVPGNASDESEAQESTSQRFEEPAWRPLNPRFQELYPKHDRQEVAHQQYQDYTMVYTINGLYGDAELSFNGVGQQPWPRENTRRLLELATSQETDDCKWFDELIVRLWLQPGGKSPKFTAVLEKHGYHPMMRHALLWQARESMDRSPTPIPLFFPSFYDSLQQHEQVPTSASTKRKKNRSSQARNLELGGASGSGSSVELSSGVGGGSQTGRNPDGFRSLVAACLHRLLGAAAKLLDGIDLTLEADNAVTIIFGPDLERVTFYSLLTSFYHTLTTSGLFADQIKALYPDLPWAEVDQRMSADVLRYRQIVAQKLEDSEYGELDDLKVGVLFGCLKRSDADFVLCLSPQNVVTFAPMMFAVLHTDQQEVTRIFIKQPKAAKGPNARCHQPEIWGNPDILNKIKEALFLAPSESKEDKERIAKVITLLAIFFNNVVNIFLSAAEKIVDFKDIMMRTKNPAYKKTSEYPDKFYYEARVRYFGFMMELLSHFKNHALPTCNKEFESDLITQVFTFFVYNPHFLYFFLKEFAAKDPALYAEFIELYQANENALTKAFFEDALHDPHFLDKMSSLPLSIRGKIQGDWLLALINNVDREFLEGAPIERKFSVLFTLQKLLRLVLRSGFNEATTHFPLDMPPGYEMPAANASYQQQIMSVWLTKLEEYARNPHDKTLVAFSIPLLANFHKDFTQLGSDLNEEKKARECSIEDVFKKKRKDLSKSISGMFAYFLAPESLFLAADFTQEIESLAKEFATLQSSQHNGPREFIEFSGRFQNLWEKLKSFSAREKLNISDEIVNLYAHFLNTKKYLENFSRESKIQQCRRYLEDATVAQEYLEQLTQQYNAIMGFETTNADALKAFVDQSYDQTLLAITFDYLLYTVAHVLPKEIKIENFSQIIAYFDQHKKTFARLFEEGSLERDYAFFALFPSREFPVNFVNQNFLQNLVQNVDEAEKRNLVLPPLLIYFVGLQLLKLEVARLKKDIASHSGPPVADIHSLFDSIFKNLTLHHEGESASFFIFRQSCFEYMQRELTQLLEMGFWKRDNPSLIPQISALLEEVKVYLLEPSEVSRARESYSAPRSRDSIFERADESGRTTQTSGEESIDGGSLTPTVKPEGGVAMDVDQALAGGASSCAL